MKYFIFLLLAPVYLCAQKMPLDHKVYDGWQNIPEHLISNDGKWIVYTVAPQEGDADLFIRAAGNPNINKVVPRGYNAAITEDSRFVVFKIKPWYKETRDARIKKKKVEELPKDSIGIVELDNLKLWKVARIKSYKLPEKGSGFVAYQKEKDPVSAKPGNLPTQKTVDSLQRKLDSLTLLVKQIKNIKSGNGDEQDIDDDPLNPSATNEGSDVVLRDLLTSKETIFKNVAEYYFNKYGQKLLLKLVKPPKDSTAKNAVVLFDLKSHTVDTLLKGGNDFRNFALSEDGSRVAFLAERDTNSRVLQKFYGLYLYKRGNDSAALLIDKKSDGMQIGYTVSENGMLSFSRSGDRLFFGTAPISKPKDTSLVDFEMAKLDIWNYKDDYLQTQQLFRLNTELKRNYLALYDFNKNRMMQLGSKGLPNVIQTGVGDGEIFVATTDTGRRVESQWTGRAREDVYVINVSAGEFKLIKKNLEGQVFPSSTGKYILLYDNKIKNYLLWNGNNLKNITASIHYPLYNEENDVPDDPGPYGIMGWSKGDSSLFIYDRYDVWKIDPDGKKSPVLVTNGRKFNNTFRYIKLDPEEQTVNDHLTFFRVFNHDNKRSGIVHYLNLKAAGSITPLSDYSYTVFQKAKNSRAFIYSKENYVLSPDLYYTELNKEQDNNELPSERLSHINPQQEKYNWGKAELYHWKTFNGRNATGILYKPEDFDATKKYPMIIYFYERLSDGLNTYSPPAPTPSRLNIPFFVSRGYLVFVPDIEYTKGHPGKDAYNYVVSGAQTLSKNKWVDAKNIGLQGQSWGGYQVAYLITATHMFKAAWAGAPVVNMFSAYGGIRWESGNNRQSQYEKGQSRIGATPWDKPELYIENSPFFHLKNITTPLVIMSNDADGAVPWYQGIEFFTAMRRLNKKIWLLSYNGEAHNLVERRNRKDIQIREQEYFDWMLKGEKPARWLTEGVPAVLKGQEWGLETED